MARIYLASSWRNEQQPQMVKNLIAMGHQVYDFRNPPSGEKGFAWSDLDPDYKTWNTDKYIRAIETHQRAAHGYVSDLRGMEWADTCVLLLPCGRSAHIEAGWMKGRGKRCIVYLPKNEPFEPELMYLLADQIVSILPDLELSLR